MGCGCGSGGAKKQEYEVVGKDGTVTVVASRTEALSLVRRNGGSWRPKKAA